MCGRVGAVKLYATLQFSNGYNFLYDFHNFFLFCAQNYRIFSKRKYITTFAQTHKTARHTTPCTHTYTHARTQIHSQSTSRHTHEIAICRLFSRSTILSDFHCYDRVGGGRIELVFFVLNGATFNTTTTIIFLFLLLLFFQSFAFSSRRRRRFGRWPFFNKMSPRQSSKWDFLIGNFVGIDKI